MAQDWDIKPRGGACVKCGRAYRDGEVCHSCLIFGEEGYQRADFCGDCWSGETPRDRAVSVWQGAYRAPAPEPEGPLRRETAESLLRRLMEEDDESKVNVIYILAVMLERGKLLVERDTRGREDGLRLRIYEHRRTGETFVVPEPALRLDQLEHVQAEVAAMLGGPAGAPPAQAAPAVTEPRSAPER